MGLILSRFRSKPNTKDVIEQIETEIESIQEYKWTTSRKQKNIIGLLFFISGLFYIVAAIVLFFYYIPRSSNWQEKCLYSLPLFIFPALVYSFKKGLQCYYRWIIDNKDDKLRELKKEKRKLLDKIMETETYKVAKELLEKYDPNSLKEKQVENSPPGRTPEGANSSVRYRGSQLAAAPLSLTYGNQFRTPNLNRPTMRQFSATNSQTTPVANPYPRPSLPAIAPPRLARPVLQQDRSVMDKLVDYVVGDGPNNRYALICTYCHSHNGMALKDEFEFISFRCCYCFCYNAARRERPFAPRLLPSSQSSRPSLTPLIDEPESDTDSVKDARVISSSVEEIVSDASSEVNVADAQNTEKESEDTIQSEVTSDMKDSMDESTLNTTSTNSGDDDDKVLM